MKTAILLFFALLFTAGLGSLAFFYWQYRHWPPFLWKQRLLRRREDLQRRREELRAAAARRHDPAAQLWERHFQRHLQAIPLDRLIEYPGIGPGTVDRLRDAGYRGIADVAESHFDDVPGIGPVRARDLRSAVRQLVREARSRFEAGAVPEAQHYRRELATLQAAQREEALARDRERTALDEALAEMDALAELAADVTFRNYLFHREVPGLTDEVLHRPLPTPREIPAPPPPSPPVAVARPVVPAVPGGQAARPTSEPFVLPPVPAPPPPPPADLFGAALATPAQALTPREEHPWLPRMRAVARFAFAVARADGRIARDERKQIRAFLETKFGHDPVLVRHIDPLLEQCEAAAVTDEEAVAGVRAFPDADRAELFALAERIADASGERNQREREALARIAAALALPAVAASAPPPPPQPSAPKPAPVEDPRAILGIPAEADLSVELIRRRYQFLREKLDPGKFTDHGPEFIRIAEEKLARVRTAAETLLAPFAAPLEAPQAPPPPADLRHNPDLDDVFN